MANADCKLCLIWKQSYARFGKMNLGKSSFKGQNHKTDFFAGQIEPINNQFQLKLKIWQMKKKNRSVQLCLKRVFCI